MTGPTSTRIAKTAPATLSHTFVTGETTADPDEVTYTVTDANGDTVTSGTADGSGAAARTFALAGQPDLARYRIDWTGTISGSTVVETDYLEIAGGFFFTLTDGRASDSSLSDAAKYPTSALEIARMEVEDECEQICDRAFVPRYRRAVLDGSGTAELILTDADWAADGRSAGDVRRIRSATIAPRYGKTAVELTADQLAACAVTADGTLRRTDGNVWTEGTLNVVVEFEYGWDRPPTDLIRATYTRLRTRLNIKNSSVPDRASSFTIADGGTYRLDLPGAWKTGIPEVDAVYGRYSRRAGAGTGTGGTQIPASRTLSYEPQRNSIFHQRSGV